MTVYRAPVFKYQDVPVVPGRDARSVTNEEDSYGNPRPDILHHGISSRSVGIDPGYDAMRALLAFIILFDIAFAVFAVIMWE